MSEVCSVNKHSPSLEGALVLFLFFAFVVICLFVVVAVVVVCVCFMTQFYLVEG